MSVNSSKYILAYLYNLVSYSTENDYTKLKNESHKYAE